LKKKKGTGPHHGEERESLTGYGSVWGGVKNHNGAKKKIANPVEMG